MFDLQTIIYFSPRAEVEDLGPDADGETLFRGGWCAIDSEKLQPLPRHGVASQKCASKLLSLGARGKAGGGGDSPHRHADRGFSRYGTIRHARSLHGPGPSGPMARNCT